MGGFEREMDNGLKAVLDYLGTAATWNNQTFRAIQADAEALFPLEAGGFAEDGDFILHARKKEFPTSLPKAGDSVTVEGKRFRITAVNTSAGDPEVRLVCAKIK